jgi:glycosyltransferase involved in cell wall biosynthesis
MIYVFYNNDPLAHDLGGGAEHFRCLHRALLSSGLPFHLVAARLQPRDDEHVTYVSEGSNFLRFYLGLWRWFWRHRREFDAQDVFHFHRNYAAWPKLVLSPRTGRVLVSYHNVTGRVLEGMLGRLAKPVRALMLVLERRVARLADAIVCVSGRDREILARTVMEQPFAEAEVIPAAYDSALFPASEARPPPPALATRLLFLGRISHQKNAPLAIETLELLVAQGGDYTLTIAGAGEDAKQLIRRIARSPVRDRIDWIGGVPHDRVPALLAEHGILLLSSRYEASPTVVKEALRALRPVVSTDVGDIADWLEHDRTGFICDQSAESLAQGVRAATRLIREGRYGASASLDAMDEAAIMAVVLQLYRRLAAG